jgi:nucleoside-diphosphate-sugar epimerase
MHRPYEGAEAFNVRGAVVPIEEFTATLRDLAPESAQLITHGTKQLPIAPSLDDSRFDAQLGPLPRTPLRDGIADTLDRFRALLAAGKIQPE